VDNAENSTTDFDLTTAQRHELFLNGVASATSFIVEMGACGRVPRSESEARQHVRQRSPNG
jgi:hypothetical protein